jgi:hypothetical protein
VAIATASPSGAAASRRRRLSRAPPTARIPLQAAAVGDHLDRLLQRAPAVHLDRLALELLVDGEEVGDLALQLLRDVVERLRRVPAGVVGGHADDLVVLALLVAAS